MKAVVVVGKKLTDKQNHFLYNATAIHSFMLKYAGCEESEIAIIRANDFFMASRFWRAITDLMQQQKHNDPLLLWYTGHGVSAGWTPYWFGSVRYDIMAHFFQKCSFPLLIVNDCCNSGSLITALEKSSFRSGQVGIIAACGKQEISFTGMTSEILNSWKKLCPYSCAETDKTTLYHRIRWGAMLDHHFYTKQTKTS